MTSQSAYCFSRENKMLDDKNDKQQISLRNFPLIRPLASLPVHDDVTFSLLSLAWKRLNVVDKNDKQQISPGNCPLIRPPASLQVQNKGFEKV